MQNRDYIEHYQLDAEYTDYFNPSAFEKEMIRRRYQALVALSRPAKESRLLEIGSGGGQLLSVIADKNIRYYPLDISLKNLKKIKAMAGAVHTRPVAGDALHLPLKDESVDTIFCSEVLEHINNPAAVLDEFYRVLRPGGKAAVSVPYKEKITYQLCVHCNRLTPTHAHLHSFDENKLRQLASESRLSPLRMLKLGNKASNRLYFNIVFNFLPWSLWRAFDRLFNLVLPKPANLIILLRK